MEHLLVDLDGVALLLLVRLEHQLTDLELLRPDAQLFLHLVEELLLEVQKHTAAARVVFEHHIAGAAQSFGLDAFLVGLVHFDLLGTQRAGVLLLRVIRLQEFLSDASGLALGKLATGADLSVEGSDVYWFVSSGFGLLFIDEGGLLVGVLPDSQP
jgi:hypothetical protein